MLFDTAAQHHWVCCWCSTTSPLHLREPSSLMMLITSQRDLNATSRVAGAISRALAVRAAGRLVARADLAALAVVLLAMPASP
jgi:hypothetical protein